MSNTVDDFLALRDAFDQIMYSMKLGSMRPNLFVAGWQEQIILEHEWKARYGDMAASSWGAKPVPGVSGKTYQELGVLGIDLIRGNETLSIKLETHDKAFPWLCAQTPSHCIGINSKKELICFQTKEQRREYGELAYINITPQKVHKPLTKKPAE